MYRMATAAKRSCGPLECEAHLCNAVCSDDTANGFDGCSGHASEKPFAVEICLLLHHLNWSMAGNSLPP